MSDIDKLKYWLDGEITFLHTMFAVILFILVSSTVFKVLIVGYIIISLLYSFARFAKVYSEDPEYLKVIKK